MGTNVSSDSSTNKISEQQRTHVKVFFLSAEGEAGLNISLRDFTLTSWPCFCVRGFMCLINSSVEPSVYPQISALSQLPKIAFSITDPFLYL